MALTLIEAAKLDPGAVIKNTVMELFAANSDILRVLPFENIQGNAVSYTREYKLPGIGFRGVNEGFDESTGILNPQSERLVIAGGDLDVDTFIVNTMGTQQRSTQEAMKVKALSLAWTRSFIKGDSSLNPRGFDGLQRRITGPQLIDNGATSGGDPLSLAMLDEAIDQVDMPTHLYMNKAMRRRITQAMRDPAVAGNINFTADEFGRRMMMYQDLPILIADYDNNGDDIMPFTEANPGGGTPASTSIYVLSIGPTMLTGIQGYINGQPGMDVRDLGELHDKPLLRTRVEWYNSIALYGGRCASRLQGITDAPVEV